MRVPAVLGLLLCSLLAGVSPAAADAISLRLAGEFTPPSWSGSMFLDGKIDLLFTFDMPVAEGDPDNPYRYLSYVEPATVQGQIGGRTLAETLTASWIQLQSGAAGTHLTFEMDRHLGGGSPFNLPVLENRRLEWMFFAFDFAPGAFPVDRPFPGILPLDSLTSADASFFFYPERGSGATPGGFSAPLSSVSQIPEPSTALMLATGLLAAHIGRRRWRRRSSDVRRSNSN
jgi:hypothetical protein